MRNEGAADGLHFMAGAQADIARPVRLAADALAAPGHALDVVEGIITDRKREKRATTARPQVMPTPLWVETGHLEKLY